jgi:DNA processing protein
MPILPSVLAVYAPNAEQLATLRVLRTPGIGPATFHRLRQRFGTAEAIIQNARHWQTGALTNSELASLASVQKEVHAVQTAGGWWVFEGEATALGTYPAALAPLPDAPIVLCGLGNPAALHMRAVGVVGNRNASAQGLTATQSLCRTLAAAGIGIVSGLARGIDTAAHTGALQSAAAHPTVAVVAGGVNHIYPPENAALREAIVARGCVVSEQPWGTVPTAQFFPRRNRIIAGLSLGVVVAEATKHSGSLITAQHTLSYGRLIWAVPGSPADPRAAGPNWLLKQGAMLLEDADDVLSQLPHTPNPLPLPRTSAPSLFDAAPVAAEPTNTPTTALPAAEGAPLPLSPLQAVLQRLGSAPVSFDDVLRQLPTDFGESTLAGLLTQLELDGHVRQELDGRWRRA